jgi:hypothetical protein
MRAALATAALAGALGMSPAATLAHGVITQNGSVLTFTATNNCQPSPCPSTLVVTTPETGILQFEDETSKGGIFWGPCTPVTEERTRCDSSGITRLDVVFDHNDDSATVETAIPVRVSGGEGDDTIDGGFGPDLLEGGPGADTIAGGAGADTVSGDAGDDAIDVRDGIADAVNCGDGSDTASIDLADPTDLAVSGGCETVLTEDTPPGDGPPDTPPDTTITRSPARETRSEAARFRFKASEPGSTYECSRDASPYRPCRSPKRIDGLRPGRHVFKVRATDAAGNTDPTTATYRWRVLA